MDFEYHLQDEDSESDKSYLVNTCKCSNSHCQLSKSKSTHFYFALFVLAIVATNVLALAVIASYVYKPQSVQNLNGNRADQVYSPAEDHVEYETITFHSSLGIDREFYPTPYLSPPSESVDRAWEALYNNYGVNQIDKETAEKLASPTLPIPGDEEHYFVGLDVFHQLHCLNYIRKALWPNYYHTRDNLTIAEAAMEELHLDHCANSIRQSLMCSGDITPMSWRFNKETQDLYPSASMPHTCRNFGRLQEWAIEHRFLGKADVTMLAAEG